MNNSGIYKITNKLNGKIYIGSSKNLKKRKLQHFTDLKTNKHHSIKLQRAYNKYGEENFEFKVIKYIDDIKLLYEMEQKYLDKYNVFKKGYNSSPLVKQPYKDEQNSYKNIIFTNSYELKFLLEELSKNEKIFILSIIPYIGYKKNIIMKTQKTSANSNFLKKITKLSHKTFYDTLNLLFKKYIIIKIKDKYLFNPIINRKDNMITIELKKIFGNYYVRSKGKYLKDL